MVQKVEQIINLEKLRIFSLLALKDMFSIPPDPHCSAPDFTVRRQVSFSELNSTESTESIDFIEYYFDFFLKMKLLEIVTYKFYRFCRLYRIQFGKTQ